MAKTPAKSTVRVPLQSVVVSREGKTVIPPIGQPFEFTADEIADIEAKNPDAIGTEATVDVTAAETKKDDI